MVESYMTQSKVQDRGNSFARRRHWYWGDVDARYSTRDVAFEVEEMHPPNSSLVLRLAPPFQRRGCVVILGDARY